MPEREPFQFGLWADDEAKLRWAQRVSRTLRKGQELTTEERAWVHLPEDEIISRLMADPRFLDGIVDFNFYYLGFKSDALKMPDGSIETSLGGGIKTYPAIPTAIRSALNTVAGGDHLSLFNIDTPFVYLQPSVTGKIVFGGSEFDFDRSRDEALVKRRAAITQLNEMSTNGATRTDFCKVYFEEFTFSGYELYGGFYIEQFADFVAEPLMETCRIIGDAPLPEDVGERLEEVMRREVALREALEALHPDVYQPRSFADLRSTDLRELGQEARVKNLSARWFWQSFPNSSTNYNRKRAAYILKRFFCDDLTPLNVELPAEHAGDRHASDPGCQSCHFKLDPLAGFFREHGYSGNDFGASSPSGPIGQPGDIFFDDFASKNLAEYVKAWRSSDDTRWDIGYVRSATDASLNDYSDHPDHPTLDDLFAIIRRAPETKQCLVESVFHHFVGEEVALDRGYLEELTEIYEEALAESSAAALQAVMRRVVKSKSFVVPTSEKGVCYDFAEGDDPAGKPPCEVSHVLQKNCATCHGATNAQGGLDLMTWTSDGADRGFRHIQNGAVVPFAETLLRLEERLNSADPRRRMPLGRVITSRDREILFKWVDDEKNRL